MFERFKKIRDAIDAALNYGGLITEVLGFVSEWNAIDEPLDTFTGLKNRLSVVIRAGKAGAAHTATTVDDAIVAQLEKLLQADELITFIAQVIHDHKVTDANQLRLALTVGPHADALAVAAAERGLDWGKLVDVLVQLWGLFESFRKGKSATETTPAPDKFDFQTKG